MTAEAVVAALEARGVRLQLDGAELVVRPASSVTPEDVAILRKVKPNVVSLLRGRALGTEVAVPWSDMRLVVTRGCRIARELRSSDPKPGRIWCVCEISDLLLIGVPPEDARKIAEIRLAFDATLEGVSKEPASPAATHE